MTGSSRWTLASMPDMSGETVVVTGANSGLGFEGTKAFARKGATVVMACRSIARGKRAADDVRHELPEADLDVRELDLADLSSVESFANTIDREYDALHVLCNNAGVMAIPRQETTDGFEMQFGVNHLGHFALTGHLLSLLRETGGETRVVTQSSGAHQQGDIDFDDINHERDYGKWEAYAQSKLANLLFAFELGRKLDDAGVDDVVSTACHPGWAATNLQRRGPEQAGSTLRLYLMKAANAVLAQDAQTGTLPMLYAATADDITGAEYIGPDGFMSMRGYPHHVEPTRKARDPDLAARLWDVSEELTGISYDLQPTATADD
jgi:NAD(P)-dependent dehydrogenase (short-subunit alcohol dehydrogenase family)